ncbi:alkene reductase [Aquipuribacter nitratireducens]|uniref:Alkene reductase n=1 Tax=Aquipuribacter nitratireducens TaxID=650104 RepID=A0ABW0GQ09_9MICO
MTDTKDTNDTNDTAAALLRPVDLGALALPNRLVMAPLTRTRTGEARRPGPLNVEYYRQRAGAGLVVSEGVAISREAVGYVGTPGLWREDQVDGWRTVTDAVHDAGGRVVAQLWHVGRISHTSFHDGHPPVSSTARPAEARSYTAAGFEATSTPRALRTDELPRVVDDYRRAAAAAREAGFDGVEVHAANGYLLEQFLAGAVNDRTDAYGGGVAARARLLAEVLDATTDGVGAADRVGVRLSLGNGTAGTHDEDPAGVLAYVGALLEERGLAYAHYVEPVTPAGRRVDLTQALRSTWRGPLVLAQGFTPATAAQVVDEGRADAVALGRAFIANPDLVERVRRGAPLTEPDPSTFYGTGPRGYTDYPALEDAAA